MADQESYRDRLKALLLKHGLELEGDIAGGLAWEPPAKIFRRAHVTDVEIGAYSYISPNTQISHTKIGRYCSIGDQVTIRGSAHPKEWLSSHPFSYQNIFPQHVTYKPPLSFQGYSTTTLIGHDVWIGAGATILPGVRIGNGAVIGAGAVVAKDIPDYAIAVGNPVQVIKSRFDIKTAADLLRLQWWRFDIPKHLAQQGAPPLDDPRRMIDYITGREGSLPRISPFYKVLDRSKDQTVIRTVQGSNLADGIVPAAAQ